MNKEALHKLAAESLNEGLSLDDWAKIGCVNHDCDKCKAQQEQWDAIPDAFNEWWNADYDDTGNPYRKDSPAYWAWSGWKAASKQPAQQWLMTDEMVTAAARALNKRQAEACGVDKNDHWKFYGDDIKVDARAVLEAAHGITKGNT